MPTSVPPMILGSPRRWRCNSEDPDQYSPSIPSPSSVSVTSLPEVKLREEEDLGRYSPRAAVASRLGQLAIRGDNFSTPQLPNGGTSQLSFASAQSGCLISSHTDTYAMSESNPLTESNDSVESGSSESIFTDQSQSFHGTPTSSPKKRMTPSPRKKRNPVKTQRPPRRRSPPPEGSATDTSLTWHDSEITGHDPTDPNDDGYGINGIGFKPTATMAWARSQRRQKQLAEWKSREAREAREKRRERRDGIDLEKLRTIQKGAIQKKVKFDV
ncbi:hypothetical protein BDV25DRAFT_136309 [Aspergillus avenaceus]|uniref:Uncharacterized protein n=1 Tax=Aspergillus avenaceus TaxID=36643 RepID=A0A5N6U5W6_ASPAV|nr:hypothetical protein BDV25DRAFT_136309 [Aspergillus avenaceus]